MHIALNPKDKPVKEPKQPWYKRLAQAVGTALGQASEDRGK